MQSFKTACDIQADIRWVLTGTPIQNDVKELKSIFSWIGVTVGNSVDSIQEAWDAFALRRTQETIGQNVEDLRLPGLEQHLVHIPFKYEEEKQLNAYVENNYEKIINRSRKADKNREAMTGILRCRQLCTHLFIFLASLHAKKSNKSKKRKADSDSDTDTDTDTDDLVVKPVSKYNLINHDHLKRIDPKIAEIFSETRRLRSTKLEYLCDAIKEHPDEKALVFCTWREEMNIIADMLASLKITSLQFHGSLDSRSKQSTIQNFSSPAVKVMLVQIDCGGTGLNLQQASRVYITSASWNPCQDLQAICRAYRTGQSRPVICTRLCIKDTVEERVLQLQLHKLSTISSYLDDKSFSDRLMGRNNTMKAEDIKYIFSSVRKAREEAELARSLAQAAGQDQDQDQDRGRGRGQDQGRDQGQDQGRDQGQGQGQGRKKRRQQKAGSDKAKEKKRPSSADSQVATKRRCGKSSSVYYEELQSRAQKIIASLPAMSFTPEGMMVLAK
jgi:SNF2 family DNA or RNA helicase